MQNKKKHAFSSAKGFTIIELIVVIAIITVLASIVMVSVTQYINKSKVASIKKSMASLNIASITYFNEPRDNYDEVCDSAGFASVRFSVLKIISSGFVCKASSLYPDCPTNSWVAYTPMPDSTTWCVDSSGYAGLIGEVSDPMNCACSDWPLPE
jgi:prepilin-type N-terminal cleavage/methylation domain-containing protein